MKRNQTITAMVGVFAATAFSVLVHAASVTPNTTLDGTAPTPDCTLREAITSVNTNTASGGCTATGAGAIDTVELPAGAYVLDITSVDDDNTSGDLDVLANITINGAGADTTSISAQGLTDNGGPERVLHINPEGDILNATINNVTIRDGFEDGDGGGIFVLGNFTPVAFLKLGIFDGTFTLATLNGVDLLENHAEDDGGGLSSDGAMVILDNCLVAGNDSFEGGGGIGAFTGDLELRISNSIIDDNTAPFGGGVDVDGFATIDSTTISNNVGACAGAGMVVEGEAILLNSTISGNRADGPCAAAGGGGEETQNIAGGIGLTSQDSLDIVNSTVSGNFAPVSGGGIALIVFTENNAGVPAANPGLRLFNTTITDNGSDGIGGGVMIITLINPLGVDLFTLSAANTIIAGNEAPDSTDCFGDFSSEGYNLIGDIQGCDGFTATGDQTGVDPELGALQDNGGPTFTHALLEGSPAIDTANPDGCLDNEGAVLTRDQRGDTRPVNATGLATAICDIGAYEFQVEASPTPTPTATPGFLLNGTGCALTEQGSVASSAPAILLLAGLAALSYRSFRRRAE